MAHEVTDILQGICRHSASGVMKARWDEEDFLQMAWKPLPFTDYDIDLIRRGLDAREARLKDKFLSNAYMKTESAELRPRATEGREPWT